MMMYFIIRKYKICHSERSEESAGARAHGPNGATWADTHTGWESLGQPLASSEWICWATDSSLRSE